jgi:signal transduction histidine kinase
VRKDIIDWSSSILSNHARKIGVIAIVLIITISFGLFFYFANISEENIRKSLFLQHQEEQIQSTEIMAQRISSDLSLVQSILQGLTGSAYLQQGELQGDNVEKLMTEAYRQINDITEIDELLIADEDDMITFNIVEKGARSLVDMDISSKDYVNETRETSNPVFSVGFEDIDDVLKIALTYPIINRDDNQYIGLVGVEMHAIEFFRRYGNVYDIESQYLAVLDNRSVPLVHPVPSLIGTPFFGNATQEITGHNSNLNNLVETVMSGQAASAVYEFRNGERLTTGYPIVIDDKPRYFNFIITPTQGIYAEINDILFDERLKMLSLVAGAIAAVLVLIILLIKWNSILNNQVKRRTRELEESNKRLKYHDKLQEDFVNNAAHELRTPIQPILGVSELLGSKTTDPEQRRLLNIIIRNAKRLQKLAQDILDVSRIESQNLLLKKERFDLNELIKDIIEEFRERVEKENRRESQHEDDKDDDDDEDDRTRINIPFNHKEDVILITADKMRLRQVISNLLDNSLKFVKSRSGSRERSVRDGKGEDNNSSNNSSNNNYHQSISIHSEVKDGSIVQVSVKDTGSGIDPEIFPRLFSKFTSKSFTGTGLGLYLCKIIIESHGGTISGKNNLDGIGATFSFSLPLEGQTT